MTKPCLSLVIPMHNEEECLDGLFRRLEAVLGELGISYEIVCVDDGSRDRTLAALIERQKHAPYLRVIDLSRNFGKEAALTAGLDASRGECVVPLDADLQDPPELIGRMLEKWREGYEVVNAVRSERQTDTPMKRWTAGLFYWSANKLSEIEIPPNVGDFRLMDRKVVDAICALPERSRFNKGLFAWVGFRQTSIEYSREARFAGETKWKYWRLWNFALDGITSFSSVPLRIWSYLGGAIAGLAIVYAIVIIVRTLLFGRDVPGYPSLIVAIMFFNGLTMLSLGAIGEYLSRIFIEAKQRPLYIVRKIHEPDAHAEEATRQSEVEA
ncbi:glycosyltransferase family 2 protein [Afifella marina]|uniref:Glycosyltransferase involved in cell wall bisynthesis n=1 Tax=Afifella marina DSM 2698 TaxID=1120955 RepID=A0A1G5MGW1_AFIMA|nr:glycosyltransferase family 2 protein [Afifella marina]MBK1625391.1 glycosyltransferase [Afifella marina DSM 2698]MBK1628994.1 glycosyltransferase [Afifella marina]MBK5916934.1 glycosyltransferase [Afifella marina]RAI22774.1 glycosyltransferase [Afifella marina DSM 2698]SCZ24396.1 Glycosyltransferase involved in cell wall bisynthesis [Afifella marina DSM 2698]